MTEQKTEATEGAQAPSKATKTKLTAVQIAVKEVEVKLAAEYKETIAQDVARVLAAREQDADAAEDEKLDMVEYRLRRSYWDGRKLFERGDVLKFRRGKAPKTAVLC